MRTLARPICLLFRENLSVKARKRVSKVNKRNNVALHVCGSTKVNNDEVAEQDEAAAAVRSKG